MRPIFAILSLLLSLALLAPVPPAKAEAARVLGGEHDGFTRLVVEGRGIGDWRFGRDAEGYVLDAGGPVTAYDLSMAFERIGRERVAGLWRDPASGRLRLRLGCACHALAFEFGPGTVVIDVRPGVAPVGSSFEEPLPPAPVPDRKPDLAPGSDPAAAPPPAPRRESPPVAPAPYAGVTGGYDWLAEHFARSDTGQPTPKVGLITADGPEFAALREALLAQISRGVSEGVVSVADPLRIAGQGGAATLPEGMRVTLGDLPGVAVATPHSPAAAYSDSGIACVEDERLDVSDWLGAEEGEAALALARTALVGEFDRPVPAAVRGGARVLIALSFGREARQVLGFLPDDEGEDGAILRAMGHLVDLELPAVNAFAGMQSCDGAAALWASLAMAVVAGTTAENRKAGGTGAAQGAEPGAAASSVAAAGPAPINGGAVGLAFSGLPMQLRRHLGPVLADLALAQDQPETARLIRDAMTRDGSSAGAGVMLADARYRLNTGDAAGAASLAQRVLEEGGTLSADAAILLAEAAFAGGSAPPPGLPKLLAAFLSDARGTGREAGLRRAFSLSLAMTGDHRTAFAVAADTPGVLADLWTLAATGADDATFLQAAFAVPGLVETAAPPHCDAATCLAVAARLLDLGFPERALRVLDPPRGLTVPGARLLAARASLAAGDARGALELLAGLGDASAETLRGQAFARLGDNQGAAIAYERAGETDARESALRLAGSWEETDLATATPWAAAASLALTGMDARGRDSTLPVLAGMRDLAGSSQRAREAAGALLDSLRATGR